MHTPDARSTAVAIAELEGLPKDTVASDAAATIGGAS
jgi:hypothetical protein